MDLLGCPAITPRLVYLLKMYIHTYFIHEIILSRLCDLLTLPTKADSLGSAKDGRSSASLVCVPGPRKSLTLSLIGWRQAERLSVPVGSGTEFSTLPPYYYYLITIVLVSSPPPVEMHHMYLLSPTRLLNLPRPLVLSVLATTSSLARPNGRLLYLPADLLIRGLPACLLLCPVGSYIPPYFFTFHASYSPYRGRAITQ